MEEPERLPWVGQPEPVAAPPPASSVREDAQDRLTVAAKTGGTTTLGVNALTLLYELASDPAQNGSALRLLHELQVHQVEIELQQEELQRVRDEADAETRRALAWFEVAPMPLLAVDLSGLMLRANRQAAKLLSLLPASAVGQPLSRFLPGADAPRLRALLLRVANGQGVLSEVFTVLPAGKPSDAAAMPAPAPAPGSASASASASASSPSPSPSPSPTPTPMRYILRAAHASGVASSVVLAFEPTA